MHFIYRTTCMITGRYYVGMHSTNKLDDGYLGSGLQLQNSITKHGPENHKREIINLCDTREELEIKEREIVNEVLITDPLCMNLRHGGNGGWRHINYPGSLYNARGRKAAAERRKNDPEYGRKISRALIKRGGNGYWKGKHHSPEARLTMSLQGRKRIGEKNSQFGSYWITNGVVNLKWKEALGVLPVGFSHGRCMGR